MRICFLLRLVGNLCEEVRVGSYPSVTPPDSRSRKSSFEVRALLFEILGARRGVFRCQSRKWIERRMLLLDGERCGRDEQDGGIFGAGMLCLYGVNQITVPWSTHVSYLHLEKMWAYSKPDRRVQRSQRRRWFYQTGDEGGSPGKGFAPVRGRFLGTHHAQDRAPNHKLPTRSRGRAWV